MGMRDALISIVNGDISLVNRDISKRNYSIQRHYSHGFVVKPKTKRLDSILQGFSHGPTDLLASRVTS